MKVIEIPLSSIYIGSRYRKDFGNVDNLAHSIRENGLITPIAVGLSEKVEEKLRPPDPSIHPFTLLAGHRRFMAIEKVLKWPTIPVRLYETEIKELDYRAIEAAENLDRKQMSYAEEVSILKRINALQLQTYGPKIAKSQGAVGWSNADTARMFDRSEASVSLDLKLADAIERYPELKLDKCKNKSEAHKRLKNMAKAITTNTRAEEYTKAFVDDELFNRLSKSYIIANCLDIIKQLPSSSIDFIEIDPPYAIDLNKLKRDNPYYSYNEISFKDYVKVMKPLLKECYRVLKNDKWLICWFAPDPWFSTVLYWLRSAGFKVRGLPCEWTKPNGQSMQPESHPASCYEMFFYAAKGSPKLHKPGRNNLFEFKPVTPTEKFHPTQRPLSLMIEIYKTFCPPNINGFIPFLGSGVGILAGHLAKMSMFGTDLAKDYKDGFTVALKEFLEEQLKGEN